MRQYMYIYTFELQIYTFSSIPSNLSAFFSIFTLRIECIPDLPEWVILILNKTGT